MSRITESELVLPALFLMSMQRDGKISTSLLIKKLQELLKPSDEDLRILSGRNDTYFSQIVRNLKSHSTFERYGYAESISGGFRITSEGRRFVIAKHEILHYLFGYTGFNYSDVLSSCDDLLNSETSRKVIPLTEFVFEGAKNKKEVTIRERSIKLRDAAREFYRNKEDGLLYCNCCNFEFSHYYYPDYSDTCIEIHHLKPLYQYEGDDFEKTIDGALKNMLPVCPNCHRVIHKNKIGANQIDLLKSNCHPFLY